MTTPVRFGIIGCGTISATHADAINQIDDAELTACCDIVLKKAQAFALHYGLGEANVYDSVADLLADDRLDAVSICTPSGTHTEIAIAVLAAGKPVIIEKPMDVTDAACSLLQSVQRESGLTVGIISQHRFDPSSTAVYKLIKEGHLGLPIFCEAQVKWYRTQEYYDSGDWRGTWELDGGGALMNQGIHTVDLMLWMMGEVETVYAVARTLAHDRIEVEDVICATLTFTSGAIGNLVASTAAYPGFPAQISIHGTEGSVVISGDALQSVSLRSGHLPRVDLQSLLNDHQAAHAVQVAQGGTKSAEDHKQPPQDQTTTQWGDAHRAQLIDFIDCLRTGREPLVNCTTGAAAVRVILAAYESARTGRIVHVK